MERRGERDESSTFSGVEVRRRPQYHSPAGTPTIKVTIETSLSEPTGFFRSQPAVMKWFTESRERSSTLTAVNPVPI